MTDIQIIILEALKDGRKIRQFGDCDFRMDGWRIPYSTIRSMEDNGLINAFCQIPVIQLEVHESMLEPWTNVQGIQHWRKTTHYHLEDKCDGRFFYRDGFFCKKLMVNAQVHLN